MGITAVARDFSHETFFPAALRVSLLEVLERSVRGAQSLEALRSLRAVQQAMCTNNLPAALRSLDRAWRCLPDDVATLAPIYGRLLMTEARDYEAALRLLQRALELAPDPDVAALIAVAFLRLRRPEDARHQLAEALAAYCVTPDGLLLHAASEVIRHPEVQEPGWIGRGPNLEFICELSPRAPSNVLDIQFDARGALARQVKITPQDARRIFNFKSPARDVLAGCVVHNRGVPLVGGAARIPADFVLDGRADCSGPRLAGWARLGWLPRQPVRLRVEDEHGNFTAGGEQPPAGPNWRWPFEIELHTAGLAGSRFAISVELPDGRWQPVPDSPLLLEAAVRSTDAESPALLGWCSSPPRPLHGESAVKRAGLTDVIIPVYRGREETLACIDSALATTDGSAQVIVVDDASDDTALIEALDALAAGHRITLLRNPVNQGFVASVNLALALHPTHDAVLLNSDTRVFDDWLMRLREAAYSGPFVGTATPLSNNGSIASYPRSLGCAMAPEQAAALHALAASANSELRVEIPVGVGFCLYLRRDCLRDVGQFDADLFGKGYGEEVDYCLRARRHGWSHQLAADVFVYHAGARSFGRRREALLDRSQRLLNLRHPGYDSFVADFQAQAPLHVARRRLDERRLQAFGGRFVLLVSLALTGGVARFVTERCASVRAEGRFPLILRAAGAGNSRRCELWTDALEAPNLCYDIPADLSGLVTLLRALPIDRIEIQHFLHLDAQVIEAALSLPVPYEVFVHDYAWICPRVTLIDGAGRYCGEPAVSVCESCVQRNGSSLGEEISVAGLRSRSAGWLGGARQVFAPSADTAERLRRHFTDLTVTVRPHRTHLVSSPLPPRDLARASVRVALIGAIGEHKGYKVLLDCARDARDRGLPLEFVVIGYTEDDAPLLDTGRVFVTGRYSDGEAPHLLQREQPDIAWLPSVWPETWCYTLDYALAAGLPIVAFDVGAIAERLRAVGQGELLRLGLEPAHINDRLLSAAAAGTPAAFATASRSEQTSLSRAGLAPNNATTSSVETHMTDSAVGKSAHGLPIPNITGEEGLSASVQVLPLPAGLYLFSVTSSDSPATDNGSELTLPAVHVGLGPGMKSKQVQFMEGPSTQGAWLFAVPDQLVAQIGEGGATLILTSVRAPGGEVLSIKVERLSSRTVAVPALSLPAAGSGVVAVGDRAPVDAPEESVFGSDAADPALSIQIGAHIRTRGDMIFTDMPWAGRIAPGLWIESFSVRPLQQFGAGDIEYKGLTGSGFETPWLSDDQSCGTKGMAVPLVGFALRLKPSPTASAYICEYSGYFQSGLTVGPLRNGAPCRSTVANDPLEGIQIRLLERTEPVSAKAAGPNGQVRATPSRGVRPVLTQSTSGP